MTFSWFPDNTVLCNFASVDGLPLLEQILDGRGRWVEAIADEARRSTHFYPKLAGIAVDGWLGEPIEITDDADIDQVERIRRAVFGGLATEPRKHLGEAQTCHVVRVWAGYENSTWVTDDREALRYARFQGITTRETKDLISESLTCGYLTRPEGFALLNGMVSAGRHLAVPPNAAHL